MDVLHDWLQASWSDLNLALPWLRALRGVRQDPIHHAEGDVWIHTRMVRDALLSIPAFQRLSDDQRALLHGAALLHDVAKPWTTRVAPDSLGVERVTAHGHSASGAIEARRILWEAGVAVPDREALVALIRHHQVPFFAVEDDTPERRVTWLSQTTRCDHLALVNEADGLGRVCADPSRLAENVELFRLLCEEVGCLSGPFPFASSHARLRYGQRKDSHRWEEPPEVFHCEMVLMAGLPGSGKDRWIRTHLADWPMVSLDSIRRAHGVDPREPQGPVAAMAREHARIHLRCKRNFVWNATNLTRALREKAVNLALCYGARVRIVYVESPFSEHGRRNRDRPHPVPEPVIQRMLRRWEVPAVTEAHEVVWVRA